MRVDASVDRFPGLLPKPISGGRRKLVVSPYPASKNGVKSELTWTHDCTLPVHEDEMLCRRLLNKLRVTAEPLFFRFVQMRILTLLLISVFFTFYFLLSTFYSLLSLEVSHA